MKTIACLFMFAVILCGCADSGKLTTRKAQSAIDEWARERIGGDVKVTGIQEIPEQNSAKVDLNYTDFKYPSTEENIFGGRVSTEKTYSGPGVAIFTHYNDGRWVLTKVSTSQEWNSTIWNKLNIEAR